MSDAILYQAATGVDVAGIGHNQDPLDILRGDLTERHSALMNKVFELCETRLPEEIKDDVAAAIWGDFIDRCKGTLKDLAEAHKDEKEPFLRGGQAVDEHFRSLRNEINDVLKQLQAPLDDYARAKIAAEKARLEKEARLRAEEERKRREAEAAEAKRIADEQAAAAAKAAEEQRLRDQQAADEAAATQAKAEEAAKAAAAEQDAQKVAEAAAAVSEAERLKKAAEEQAAAAAAEAARLQKEAEEQAAQAPPPVAEVVAAPVEDPQFSIRGHAGKVGGREEWTFKVTDWSKVDLNLYSRYFAQDHILKAIKAAVKAGLRDGGPGVSIYKDVKVSVR